MRIYSKVTFSFQNNGSVARERVLIGAEEIKDMPDWIASTKTFRDGQKAGLIEVLQNREQEIRAEKAAGDRPARGKKSGA